MNPQSLTREHALAHKRAGIKQRECGTLEGLHKYFAWRESQRGGK